MNNTITVQNHQQFMDVIASLTEKGLPFNARYDAFIIVLTGGY